MITGTIAVCLMLTAIFLLTPRCHAKDIQGTTPTQRKASEYEIKAVYLYNFLMFVGWPDGERGSQKTICIGIVGRDPFGNNFSKVEGKNVKTKNKKLVIKRLGNYSDGLDVTGCSMLFIAKDEQGNTSRILGLIGNRPILTVSETGGFLEKGGIINLLQIQNHIRWEINHSKAKSAGLHISSQLLRAAIRVIDASVNNKAHSTANKPLNMQKRISQDAVK